MSDIITLFRKHGNPKIAIDYLKARDLAIEIVSNKGGWANLSDKEKDYVIEFFIDDPTVPKGTSDQNKITHLMARGMTTPDAITYLQSRYPIYHMGERESCLKRAQSEDITAVMQKYLNISDMADFVKVSKNLYDDYKDEGIRGSQEGSHGMGLFDFIENTGDFAMQGLIEQGYVLKIGTLQDFITELMDILRNGNYKK